MEIFPIIQNENLQDTGPETVSPSHKVMSICDLTGPVNDLSEALDPCTNGGAKALLAMLVLLVCKIHLTNFDQYESFHLLLLQH